MKFANEKENIETCVRYVQKELERAGINRKSITQTILTLEDVLSMLINKGRPGSDFSVHIKQILGSVSVHLKSAGEPFDKSDITNQFAFDKEGLEPHETSVIDSLIEQTIGSTLRISHSKCINKCVITVEKSNFSSLVVMLGALAGGLLCGLLLKTLVSPDFAQAAADNLFSPVNTMFLNALKMIVGPLTFLSIASSIVGFDDIRALGKTAGKVSAWFMIISFIGTVMGYCAYRIMPIGDASIKAAVSDSAKETVQAAGNMDNSIISTITSIIPSDIVSPFLNMSMLQMIFMAVLFGIGIITCDSVKNTGFAALVSGANDVVMKITNYIIAFMPVSVFCSMAVLAANMEVSKFSEVIMWVPACYLGQFLLILAYLMLILIFVKVNPLAFMRDVSPSVLTAFATGSCQAAMPSAMKFSEEKLGISPKICAFAIPLGVAANKSGVCTTLVVTLLFMVKTFNVTLSIGIAITLFVTILMFSVASPAVPGGCLISMAVIFPMAGIPAEAVSIVMGLYCLIGMPQTAASLIGNIVTTAITAKSEKLMNYRKSS